MLLVHKVKGGIGAEVGGLLSLLILLTLSPLISLVLLLSQVKRTLSSAPLVQRLSQQKMGKRTFTASIVAVIALAAVLFVAVMLLGSLVVVS
jgi:hypothetical protein